LSAATAAALILTDELAVLLPNDDRHRQCVLGCAKASGELVTVTFIAFL
jgi:hypothetical protein